MSEPKGVWDFVDLVVKIIGTALLGLLAFIIPNASQRIAASIDTGRLVQSLMSDLTTSNQQTRQDLALIALNRSVGKDNKQLVSDIAERIYFDVSTRDSLHHGLGRVAFAILREQDPKRAKAVQDSIEKEASGARTQIVSPANADSSRATTEAAAPQAQLVSQIHPLVAYIQFLNPRDRAVAEELRAVVTAQGFWAPGVDQVDGNYRNWVRYFHEEDAAAAARARDAVEAFFQKKGINVSFKVQNVGGRGFKAPQGQIEIWLHAPANPNTSPPPTH